MENNKIVSSLRNKIFDTLSPLLSRRVLLTDLPYHDNLGDVLIWKGEIDFLKKNKTDLLESSSVFTFTFPDVDKDVTILLHGGGNFGDLYGDFHSFKKKVIAHYPNNRIVMFPQSVWYENESLIEEDARAFAQHKDLYLCARDQWSYNFFKAHFGANNILLVPDMAFCISDEILAPYRGKEIGKNLFFRRLDKELTNSTPQSLGQECEVRDWPTVEEKPRRFYYFDKAYSVARRLKRFKHVNHAVNHCIDRLADILIRDKLVRTGCEFLSPYSLIITTRLHAMILSVLLYKKVEYIDNSTGKLSAFAETWLQDLDSVKKFQND